MTAETYDNKSLWLTTECYNTRAMLDAILDWATVVLPTILSIGGVFVSIRAPRSKYHRSWRIGLITVGIVISGATFLQQSRSRTSHAVEVAGLNSNLQAVLGKTESLQKDQQAEVARREQAEHDMALIVQRTAALTRTGIRANMAALDDNTRRVVLLNQAPQLIAELRNIWEGWRNGDTAARHSAPLGKGDPGYIKQREDVAKQMTSQLKLLMANARSTRDQLLDWAPPEMRRNFSGANERMTTIFDKVAAGETIHHEDLAIVVGQLDRVVSRVSAVPPRPKQ
jgi:hypothetical protein